MLLINEITKPMLVLFPPEICQSWERDSMKLPWEHLYTREITTLIINYMELKIIYTITNHIFLTFLTFLQLNCIYHMCDWYINIPCYRSKWKIKAWLQYIIYFFYFFLFFNYLKMESDINQACVVATVLMVSVQKFESHFFSDFTNFRQWPSGSDRFGFLWSSWSTSWWL